MTKDPGSGTVVAVADVDYIHRFLALPPSKRVDFEVCAGEVFGLLGQNGTGETLDHNGQVPGGRLDIF